MNIDNKFLLVCLQLIIVVLMSMNVEGMPDVSSLTDSSQDRPTSRAYYLYNQCALKNIVIQDRISTTDNTDDKAILILESVMMKDEAKPRIQIRGNSSGMYLCFNNRGKLVSKHKNVLLQKKKRIEKCQFYEESNGGGWSFKSVKNANWYIGFSHKGSPMKGSDHVLTDCPECFQYTKVPIDGSSNTKEHNKKVGNPGQVATGVDQNVFLQNKGTEPPRHRHEHGIISSRSGHMRHTKKSHRNRKSFSRTKIER